MAMPVGEVGQKLASALTLRASHSQLIRCSL